ncbi:MAG TPA: TetR/AcrR family transcriptional regulator [Chloroflexota bacterium]|nr:TetR/AcrR family transcriptional regulator [Chloroflexota bacterium]
MLPSNRAAAKRLRAAVEPIGMSGKRHANVQRTRDRVVDAARQLLIEGGLAGLTMGHVARRAEVAPSTVYYQFDSKVALLGAVLDDAERRANVDWLREALAETDPMSALIVCIRRGCRFWFADYALLQRLMALSGADPQVAEVISGWNDDRLRAMDHLTERLAAAGLVPAGSKRRVASILSLATSFETFQQLLVANVAVPDRIAATLIELCQAVLNLKPEVAAG